VLTRLGGTEKLQLLGPISLANHGRTRPHRAAGDRDPVGDQDDLRAAGGKLGQKRPERLQARFAFGWSLVERVEGGHLLDRPETKQHRGLEAAPPLAGVHRRRGDTGSAQPGTETPRLLAALRIEIPLGCAIAQAKRLQIAGTRRPGVAEHDHMAAFVQMFERAPLAATKPMTSTSPRTCRRKIAATLALILPVILTAPSLPSPRRRMTKMRLGTRAKPQKTGGRPRSEEAAARSPARRSGLVRQLLVIGCSHRDGMDLPCPTVANLQRRGRKASRPALRLQRL
jgi:hypothetical protein